MFQLSSISRHGVNDVTVRKNSQKNASSSIRSGAAGNSTSGSRNDRTFPLGGSGSRVGRVASLSSSSSSVGTLVPSTTASPSSSSATSSSSTPAGQSAITSPVYPRAVARERSPRTSPDVGRTPNTSTATHLPHPSDEHAHLVAHPHTSGHAAASGTPTTPSARPSTAVASPVLPRRLDAALAEEGTDDAVAAPSPADGHGPIGDALHVAYWRTDSRELALAERASSARRSPWARPIADRARDVDWVAVYEELEYEGFARLSSLVSPFEVAQVRAQLVTDMRRRPWHVGAAGAGRVEMEAEVPMLGEVRSVLYSWLQPVANRVASQRTRWPSASGRYLANLEEVDYLASSRGQCAPPYTAVVLPDGAHVAPRKATCPKDDPTFPFVAIVALNERTRDYNGGELHVQLRMHDEQESIQTNIEVDEGDVLIVCGSTLYQHFARPQDEQDALVQAEVARMRKLNVGMKRPRTPQEEVERAMARIDPNTAELAHVALGYRPVHSGVGMFMEVRFARGTGSEEEYEWPIH